MSNSRTGTETYGSGSNSVLIGSGLVLGSGSDSWFFCSSLHVPNVMSHGELLDPLQQGNRGEKSVNGEGSEKEVKSWPLWGEES
ncbi:hypothetical protein Tco_1069351 [Tanacetum coccineum]|uniref:Uncharacterized protein n=1 Tax=Tanacetum coccineum TaxID=301880 RepID=A0ABQ5HJE3_9ASTR